MTDIPATLRCPRCGREAGAIFGCSDRASARCSFDWQGESRDFLALAGIAVAVLLMAVLARRLPWLSLGLVLLGGGLVLWGLAREVQLFDAQHGIRLHRTTVGRFELSYEWTLTERQLPIRLDPGQPLVDPLSVVALAASVVISRQDTHVLAAHLLRAALIDLIARQSIAVYRVESYVLRRWHRSPGRVARYVIAAARPADQLAGAGVLENDILGILNLWPLTTRARERGTRGPSIHDLVIDLAGRDKSSYANWLIERVANEAAARGLGQLRSSLWWRNFEWDVTRADQLAAAGELMRRLSTQLADLDPHFSAELDRQVLSALHNRAPSD
jgi:hypothetical protein